MGPNLIQFLRYTRILQIILVNIYHAGAVHAGPPLTIDDPGILDSGQWEIIGAVTGSGTDDINVYQAVLDVSVGLTENTQLSAVYPYVWADPAIGDSHTQFGNLAVGFKWRFYDAERLQLAFAPAYAFGIVLSAALRGIGDDTDILFLPVNFAWSLGGDWTLNGEFGYVSTKADTDGFGYGVGMAHPFGAKTQLMFEFYGGSDTDFDQDSLNFNVGLDYQVGSAWHLLGAAGAGLREPDSREKLDFNVYLGVQYFR